MGYQLTQKYLKPIIPEALNYGLEDIYKKTNSLILNELYPSKEQQWLNKIHVRLPIFQKQSTIQQQILDAIHTALFNNHILKISSEFLQQGQIFIEPLGLSIQNNIILLIFRITEQHPIHTIALSHIDEAHTTTFSFIYPSKFRIESFMNEYEKPTEYNLNKLTL